MNRDKKLTVRFTELEINLIKANGAIEGFKTPSSYIRFVLGLKQKLKN
jgi:predicted DNA binding CopG/RHH family protein